MPNSFDPEPGKALYLRLEVTPESSHQEIVAAYRRLVHGAHPDARPGDPGAAARFRRITEAYEVLSDPRRRAAYDRAPTERSPDVTSPTGAGPHRPTTTDDGARPGPPPALRIDGGPLISPAVALWAGPVHVEPGSRSGATDPSESLAGRPADLVSLMAHLLESWWGY